MATTAEEIWSAVAKAGPDECWLWTMSRHANGYGKVYWKGRIRRAHRLIWELENGLIPDGLYVCHTCDNPPCCNPTHLWLGTYEDNMLDMYRKGRAPKQSRKQRV